MVTVLGPLVTVVCSLSLGPYAGVAVADGDDVAALNVASAHCHPGVTAVCSRLPLMMRTVVGSGDQRQAVNHNLWL